ncbi:MAG TPA: ABC transporter permease [Xanthobacteraceae bacterium]|nr:ABC transporter permease [Xanthobacteraceae bacterium]
MNARLEKTMPWLFVLGSVLVWELACIAFRIPSFVLPRPSLVAMALYERFGPIIDNSWMTLVRTLFGFAIAVVLGALLGIAIGSSRLIYRGLYPVLIGFNSIPKVAVVPVFVIWFGIGTIPAVLTAFLVSFFPIAVNVATGLATIEPELLDVMRSLGATKSKILIKVGLPRAMPYFFASLKVAITLAFVGTIISETVAANKGIGYLMMAATSNFDTPLVFAGLIVIAAMGIAMYAIFAIVEQRMTFWAKRGDGIMA